MDQFYSIVIAIAFGILILCLIAVGIMMQNQDADKAFPSHASQCPDGWAMDASGCQIPVVGHPNFPKDVTQLGNVEVFNKTGGLYNNSEFAGSTSNTDYQNEYVAFNENATTCDKKIWTKEVGVTWDGISNYNKCDK